METTVIESRIQKKGVKPTANRITVFRTLSEMQGPVSLSDLEDRLPTLDRSSIFRTLTLFLEHHLLHSIEDGSGSLKYEMCGNDDDCSIDDMHVHFHCEVCGKTYCFEDLHIPSVDLPSGFIPRSVNYVVKGICDSCKNKQ